jgi:maleylacetate reductase
LRETHFTSHSHEQPFADRFLEGLDLLTDCAMGDMKFLCRAGEIPVAGRGLEEAESVERWQTHDFSMLARLTAPVKKYGWLDASEGRDTGSWNKESFMVAAAKLLNYGVSMRQGHFSIPPMERVYFGRPFVEAVLEEVLRLGSQRVFLLVSNTLNNKTDEIDKLKTALGEKFAALHDDIPAHIPRDAVLRGAAVAREAKADLIVSVGGGSVTDAGKNIALCLEHNITGLDQFEPFRLKTDPVTGEVDAPVFRGPTVRQIAVPTTLSGGEFHQSGGSNDPVKHLKQSIRNPLMIPRTVIFDPVLTLHTPLGLWLSTGMRSVDHAVESFCSPYGSPFVDGTALQALRTLPDALKKTKADPSDLDARAQAQAGMWLSQMGMWSLVPMGASHGIGHVLAGTAQVAHGHCTCVTLPEVLRFNKPVTEEKQRLISEALGDPNREAADLVAELIDYLEMPNRLHKVGVTPDKFELIAKNAMLDRWVHSNPRKLNGPEDVLNILNAIA